jgi:hypothetical protein
MEINNILHTHEAIISDEKNTSEKLVAIAFWK